MLDELRNQIVLLACIRHGLNPGHGRHVDRMPRHELAALANARAAEVTATALEAPKRDLVGLFVAEVERHDATRAAELREPLRTLADRTG